MGQLSLTFCRHGNFGDKLNLSLAKALDIPLHRHAFSEKVEEEVSVLGIGTLLTPRLQVAPVTRLIVFGSGAGTQNGHIRLPGKIDVRFLRGPMSCDLLGLPRKFAVTDSAYLFGPRFRELAREVPKERPVGYIPHWISPKLLPKLWKSGAAGENLIDPMQPLDAFVRQVAGCERIVTEALHGAILADALRIPFAVVQTSPHFNAFKWQDWLRSMAMDFRIGSLDSDAPRDFKLSADRVLAAAERRIGEEFGRLAAEIGALRAGG